MARFITPGKSPNKYARFYRNKVVTTAPSVLVIDDVSVARAIQTTDVSTTLTSASFAPTSANQLMLVCANLNQSVAANTFTISDSVNGSTGWTQAILADGSNSTYLGSAAIWYRLAGSTAPRTITMTDSVGRTKTFKTYLISGQDLNNPIGATSRFSITSANYLATGYTSTRPITHGFISAIEYTSNNVFTTSSDIEDIYVLATRYSALSGYKPSDTIASSTPVTFDIQIPLASNTINYVTVEIVTALASAVNNSSITSATTDLSDVSSASINPSTAISGNTNDWCDVSNAQLTSNTSISSSATDLRDTSNATINPTIAITSTTIDSVDVNSAQLSPTTAINSTAIDGADISNAQLTSNTSINSAANDLSDLSNAQLTSSTSINSTASDGQDLSNASISPASSVSSNSTDGADVSSALISPIQSSSITSAVIDGVDLLNAQLTSTIGINSTATDRQDTSLAQLTSSTAITSASNDLQDLSNAQLTSSTRIAGNSADGADISNASVSPTTSISAINIDGLDVSIAALSPSAQISSNAIDSADISSALISPAGQSPSISSTVVDGSDTNSATLAPATSITSATIDGLDYAGLLIDETVILSPVGYKYTGNHYVRRTSPTFPTYVPAVKIIKEKLPEVIETSLIDAFNLPTTKINVEAVASKIKVNEKLLVSIRAENSRLNDEINALHLLALATAKRKKQLLLLMLFEFMA